MNIAGKKAIVTGATGALGSVITRHLVAAGVHVAVPVSSEASLGRIRRESPGPVVTAVADLTVPTEVTSFIDLVVREFTRVDILVNAAGGYAGGKAIEAYTFEETETMMRLNFRTALLMCQAVLPIMKASGFGRIVNITSQPGVTPKAGAGPYAIAKRAVITLTETIADEVKGSGITINAIAPSILLTEANRRSMPGADVTKWVDPSEIAFLVHILCADESRSLNGNVLKVYGGM